MLVYLKKISLTFQNHHFQSVSTASNLSHPVLEPPLWCFSSLANHFVLGFQHFNSNLGHQRNDPKYCDIAHLRKIKKIHMQIKIYQTQTTA